MTVTRFDLGLEFSGGFPAPTVEECEALKLCRAKLDAVGEPSLEYVAAEDAVAGDGTLAAALAPFLRGTGLTVGSDDTLRPRRRPRLLQLEDRFISGNATSGSIGGLGWNLNGVGSPSAARASASLSTVGKLTISTGTSANDRGSLTLGSAEGSAGVATAAQTRLLQTVWSPTVVTDKRAFFGLSSNFATEAAAMANGLGIFVDSGIGSNYYLIARASSSGSPVDTGVAAAAGLISIWQPISGTYQFYLGNTLLGSISSGVPTVDCNIGFRLETLTGSAKTLNLGYFNLEAEVAGAFDDDTFLEA